MIKVKDEAKEVLGQPGIPLSAAQRLTEKRTLAAPHQKTHSGCSGARKMRLSVTSNSKMRLSVECAFPHLGKRSAGSRKSALCPDGLMEKRTLRSSPIGKTQFEVASYGKAHSVGFGGRRVRLSVTSPPGRCGTKPPASLRGTMENGPTGQMRSSNPPPACGALWEMAQLGKCARATARQPAGRLAPSSRNGDDHVCDRPHPSCASTRPLKSCGFVQTTATRVQTLTQEVPFP